MNFLILGKQFTSKTLSFVLHTYQSDYYVIKSLGFLTYNFPLFSEIFSVNVPSQSMPHLETENLPETDVNTMRITMNVPKRKTRAKTVENAGKIFTLFKFLTRNRKI